MHPPRIGIPLSLDDQGRWREGRDYHYIDRRYADAVDRAGGIPVHLPIQSDPAALVSELDGLVIPGGDDFPSDRPLPPNVRLELVAAAQLAFDEALLLRARARGLPVLGICYGMQLMARSRGGVLEAHLPSQPPGRQPDQPPDQPSDRQPDRRHSQPSGRQLAQEPSRGHPGPDLAPGEHRLLPDQRHAITVEADSLLASILEPGAREVNSLHHQAVRDPGRDYRVSARAPDGVIEAIEAENRAGLSPWEIGVQWHPEKMDEDGSRKLFRAFVEACRRRLENPPREEAAGRAS